MTSRLVSGYCRISMSSISESFLDTFRPMSVRYSLTDMEELSLVCSISPADSSSFNFFGMLLFLETAW